MQMGKLSIVAMCLVWLPAMAAQKLDFSDQAWLDEEGATFSLSEVEGTPIVLSLFYTDCTNTCNLTIERFKQIDEKYSAANIHAQFILLTLDPENDTPQVLQTFRKERAPAKPYWHLLSSDEQTVTQVARQLGYDFMRLDDHVFHRMRIFVIDANSSIAKVITIKTDITNLDIPGARP